VHGRNRAQPRKVLAHRQVAALSGAPIMPPAGSHDQRNSTIARGHSRQAGPRAPARGLPSHDTGL